MAESIKSTEKLSKAVRVYYWTIVELSELAYEGSGKGFPTVCFHQTTVHEVYAHGGHRSSKLTNTPLPWILGLLVIPIGLDSSDNSETTCEESDIL